MGWRHTWTVPRVAVKDHGTKRRLSPSSPPESHLTQVRNLHHNWLLSPNKRNKNFGLLWLLVGFEAASWRSTWIMPIRTKSKTKTAPRSDSSSPSAVWHVWRTGWLEIKSVSFTQILSSGSFPGHFPEWREVRVKCANMSERPELGSLGSVDSRPKAPQELMGTCEGPSNVTWLGPLCHRQEGTMGGTCHFHHPHLGCSGQCFCKISAHLLNFYP